MMCETVTRRVPYYECRQEAYTVNRRTCRRVARQVPYTVCRMVPRVVERQVAYEQCVLVPETICQAGCNDGCASGGCNTAPDAANPQPQEQRTNRFPTPAEGEPASEPRPAPKA
jgi:hypothetical protein